MINRNYIKADLKQIKQEPIMLLFVGLVLILIGVFKGMIEVGLPLVEKEFGYNLEVYHTYIVSMVYMLIPIMLGTVMGFFMLDEKDAKIFELLRVTPLGVSGYVVNRLCIPVLLCVIYMCLTYGVIAREFHSGLYLLVIGPYLILETIGVGLFIAAVSEDKVKGLTYAKAVSILTVFGFVDLIPLPFIKVVGLIVPQYYVTASIQGGPPGILLLGVVVHGIWVYLIVKKSTLIIS